MVEMILDALRQTWSTYIEAAWRLLPRVLATLSVVLVGWGVATALRWVVRRALELARFDVLARRLGLSGVLVKAELPPASALAGSLAYWLVFLSFLLAGIQAMGFVGLEGLLVSFLRLIPNVILAFFILVMGVLVANVVWRATLLAAVNASMPSARLVSGAARFLIVVLAVAMALEQIAIARTVLLTAFTMVFGAVMLAMAIAFGIGGGPLARRLLESQFPEKRSSGGGGSRTCEERAPAQPWLSSDMVSLGEREHGHQILQGFGFGRELHCRGREFLRRRGLLLCRAVDLQQRPAHLRDAARLFRGGRSHLRDETRGGADRRDEVAEELA